MRATADYTLLRIWQRIWIASLAKDTDALASAVATHGLWHAKIISDPAGLAAAEQRLRDIIATTSDDDKRVALARLRAALVQPCTPPARERPVRIRKRKAMA